MNSILKTSEEAISRYFTTLSQFGYKNYEAVNVLILLLFIEEIFSGELSCFIDEDDYKVIIGTLYCLASKTCMIDLDVLSLDDSITHKSSTNYILRISEDTILRNTQDDDFRIEA